MMETEASPAPSPSSPSSNYPFQGDFSAFGDLFSQSQSQSQNSTEQPLHNPNATLSPGQNFADLLAEFTSPGNALSPQTLESLVGNCGNGTRGGQGGEEVVGLDGQDGGGGMSNAPSPQHHQPQHPINQNDVNLQFQQFIAASLANGSTGGIPTPTPHQFTPQQQYHSQNPSHQSSPAASNNQSLPNSHAPSPLPSFSNLTPSNPIFLPQQQQQQQHFSQPPMHQSPYVMVPNPYSVGPEQYSIPAQTAAVFAHQFAMLQSQGQQQMANVLAQAQAIVQANQVAQAQHIQQQQQQQSIGSQSTSADSEWRENEFMFSPLMSPAMTPGSAYTPASSLPPSVGPLPLSAPSDFFPPLTSPALGPQMYSSDQHSHNLSHRNSLQGLVDGVGALSTHLPPGSPLTFPYQSPQMRAIDAGHNTAAGSGRRGASSTNKKTRPSPLIKASDPALDPNRRKRRTTTSNGNKSASNSPYISATNPKTGSTPGAFSAASSSNGGGGMSQKTSPIEFNHGIDTPSPVDLTSSSFSMKNGVGLDGLPIPPTSFASSSQPYQLEPMGPPPPPHHSHHASSQPLSTSASSSGSFNPITPATIMNFSSDFDLSTLSSLSPALGPISDGGPGSAFSGSLQNSPILLPQPDSGEAVTVSSAGKVRNTRKSGSIKASPALRAVDAKGKGKATEGSNGKKGGAAKQSKVAPSPKVSASSKIRPLLAADAAPDAQTRLASKSNYENIADGRGSDLLGLDASTLSAIQPAASTNNGGTSETRKSTHKLAEQKRRDSLKLCFDELRSLLPPILPSTDDSNRRPGEGNVGGQRNGEVDPENPNKGVSKVALLRRSNEYLEILRERIERRDKAIWALRRQNEMLKGRRSELGSTPDENDEEGEGQEEDEEEEIPGLDLDLDNIDGGERIAGNLAFYEDLDFESKFATPPIARRGSTSSSRRTSTTSTSTSKPTTRRSTRNTVQPNMNEDMEVEG